MLQKLLIVIIVAGVLVSCSTQEEPTEDAELRLLVGVDPNYAPFEFGDTEGGELRGFDIDLMRAIGEHNGWQVEFRRVPFDRLLASLTSGETGAAISAITITPQRRAVVDFSDPYYLSGQSLVVQDDDTSITGLGDLRGQRVGVQQGTTAEDLAKGTDGALVFRYDDIDEAFRLLAEDGLDAVINDCPSTRSYLEAHEGFRVADPDVDAEYYGIAVPKDNPDRLAAINNALALLIGNGTYDSLHVKWFGYSWFEEPPCDSLNTR